MKKITLILLVLVIIFLLAIFPGFTACAGYSGNYLEFNGGYVKVVNPDTSYPSAFSFEAWVKPQNSSDHKIIFSAGSKNPNPNLWGQQNYEIGTSGSNFYFDHRFDTNGVSGVITNGMKLGEWNHLAVTISGSTTKLFINGKLMFAPSVTGSLFPVGPDIILGDTYTENSQYSYPFKGLVDEVRISKIVRDIPALWNLGTYNLPLTTDNDTLFLWHLDEKRGETIAFDASVNNLNGTLLGGDWKIHFYGVLPSPTPFSFVLPTISWNRPVLPTLSLPTLIVNPTESPSPSDPSPTPFDIRNWPRPTRSFRSI